MNGECKKGGEFHIYTDAEIKVRHPPAEKILGAIRRVAKWVDEEIEKAVEEAEREGKKKQ